MGKKKREKEEKAGSFSVGTTVDLIGEDLTQTVLSKLPAKSFASAACVSRSWNSVCRRVLSFPKFSSAVSLNPSLKVAVEEVVNKILSVPIRPHFAILCIAHSFNLRLAHKYVTAKLGSTTPVVSYKSHGIMGMNALTNEFEEIQWDHNFQIDHLSTDVSFGISLTVGFLPGLKVDALPLLRSEDFQVPTVDKFVLDIREYTNSVSGCTSPSGIIMFGGQGVDIQHVLDKMDYAMHPDTFIVGDEFCDFLYRTSTGDAGNHTQHKEHCAGIALLFMKDRNKPRGIGDIQFHVAISAGMTPIGPIFKAAAVKEISKEYSTWLSATNGERREHINGQTMLEDIDGQLVDQNAQAELYIGVTKRRKLSVGEEKPRWSTSLAFHAVNDGDETYLFVHGCGIKTGDYFRFYYPDSSTARSSCRNVSKDLEKLKQDSDASADKKQAFGGFIFACCGRGEPFFGDTKVDIAPFQENFPGVPLGGTFCSGEIKRGSSSMYYRESEDQSSTRCCIHPYSSIYLVMSYTLPQKETPI